jgi:archaellum component FlaF (FlaF/FlaG flagellin family)
MHPKADYFTHTHTHIYIYYIYNIFSTSTYINLKYKGSIIFRMCDVNIMQSNYKLTKK